VIRPTILDLFCKAGGAAKGYSDAGFTVLGVDIAPQPNYPFPFVQADALDALRSLIDGCGPLGGFTFDAIHASPPCQLYSQATNMHDKTQYPDLVGPTRELLEATGLPYIIENVPGAPLINPVVYCGSMFLQPRLRRHRHFETNWPLVSQECIHDIQSDLLSVTGHGEGGSHRNGTKRGPYWGQAERRKAMGIDWMNRTELAESIPPYFTAHVGRQLIDRLGVTT